MLEYINDPNDIKQIQPEDYKLLAKDIRRFLLRNVSRTGGHLASNLGESEAISWDEWIPEEKRKRL